MSCNQKVNKRVRRWKEQQKLNSKHQLVVYLLENCLYTKKWNNKTCFKAVKSRERKQSKDVLGFFFFSSELIYNRTKFILFMKASSSIYYMNIKWLYLQAVQLNCVENQLANYSFLVKLTNAVILCNWNRFPSLTKSTSV